MCLLDAALDCSAGEITCSARSHLSPDNPLRRDGQLNSLCGIEYGLQAAALHGALSSGSQSLGFLAALRDVSIHTERLDEPSVGTLRVTATQEMCTPRGLIYRFTIAAEDGTELLSGRTVVVRPTAADDAP
jgi:predicted hotdog family 3-hydroxylacyl-ACP dehydratase